MKAGSINVDLKLYYKGIETRLSIDEINEYVIHNLEQTLAEFCSNAANYERKLPLEYSILKMEAENFRN